MWRRHIDSIAPSDLQDNRIWEFVIDDESEDDMVVRPVGRVPAYDLANRLVATQVHLANGAIKWARLGNINLWNKKSTEHLATIAVLHDERWIPLARYHDPGAERWGPRAFATTLGLRLEDVFPIAYDIRNCCVGDPNVVVGTFEAEPRRRLSQDEIQALSRSR